MPIFEVELSNCFENVRFFMKKCKKLSFFQELCSSIMKNLLNWWRNKAVCISWYPMAQTESFLQHSIFPNMVEADLKYLFKTKCDTQFRKHLGKFSQSSYYPRRPMTKMNQFRRICTSFVSKIAIYEMLHKVVDWGLDNIDHVHRIRTEIIQFDWS